MKVQTALFARYAEVEPRGGLLNVTGGGVDVFGLRRLPAETTVALVLQLAFSEDEAGVDQELAIVVRGPDLEVVGGRVAWNITPITGEFHMPGWRGIYSIAGALTLELARPGAYSAGIQINGAEAGDIPFQVVLAGE